MYVKVATQHGDKLSGILESLDANEIWVVASSNVPDSASLYCLWPFKVPPECCKDAAAAYSV